MGALLRWTRSRDTRAADFLDLEVENIILDDWWRLAAGECRDGSLNVHHDGFTVSASCRLLMGADFIAFKNWMSGYPAPGRARLVLLATRSTPTSLTATKRSGAG